jgi:hypothetical protein
MEYTLYADYLFNKYTPRNYLTFDNWIKSELMRNITYLGRIGTANIDSLRILYYSKYSTTYCFCATLLFGSYYNTVIGKIFAEKNFCDNNIGGTKMPCYGMHKGILVPPILFP